MARQLPAALAIRCHSNGHPVHAAWVKVIIETSVKNDFVLLFGPSDENGSLRVDRDSMLEEAESERQLFSMDYGGPEIDWKGVIRVIPLTLSDVRAAIEAFELYAEVSSYRPQYLADLSRAEADLEAREDAFLSVEVETEPPGAAVVVTESRIN